MAVPYHTHMFEIPQATKDDVLVGVSTDKAVVPAALGTAATKNIEYFATAAQGESADNAVQPSDLAAVATSGSYTDLINRPALGTAAAQDVSAFATALQGGKADTAVQPSALGSAAYENVAAFASAAQGVKADSAVQPTLSVSTGTGLTGGGTLAANRTIALSSASIASLALADTAVQPERQIIAGAGLTGGGTLAADRTLSLDAATVSSLGRADTAVQPARTVSAGTGLTGGGDLSANRTIALNAASIASLAKADSAVQPARQVSTGAGLSGGGDLSADRSLSLSAATQASLAKADTALQAPGGATGQILAKNSNTDNDVAWMSSEAATAVSYGPQTLTEEQKGQARANIDAGILAGLRNKIINGGFDIQQRQGPFTSSGYTLDRWYLGLSVSGASSSVVRIVHDNGQTDVPGNPTYYLRWARTVAGSSEISLQQKIENVRTLQGQRATLTFYIKGSAPTVITPKFEQNFGTDNSPSPSVWTTLASVNVTTSWQKVTRVFDLPSISGKSLGASNYLNLFFGWLHTAPNASIDISRVSLVEGDATAEDDPFSPRHIQQELALCQRYFQTVLGGSMGDGGLGMYYGAAVSFENMRATPSYTIRSIIRSENSHGIVAEDIQPNSMFAVAQFTATGFGTFRAIYNLDAEL